MQLIKALVIRFDCCPVLEAIMYITDVNIVYLRDLSKLLLEISYEFEAPQILLKHQNEIS